MSVSPNPSQRLKILVVDDDPDLQAILKSFLEYEGFVCRSAINLQQMKELLQAERFDCALLDWQLGLEDGLDGLPFLYETSPLTQVIVMTGHGSIDLAVKSMELGAATFIAKTDDPFKIIETVRARLKKSDPKPLPMGAVSQEELGLIGESPRMKQVLQQLLQIRHVDVNVLILGESGTGKELVAQALHRLSHRCQQSFEALNCGAIPESLLESELFGHKKGAFTDARIDRKGLFEVCSDGTLFLDEIGEMPLNIQVKLLRVIQEREIRPLGASRSFKIQTRLIAATNRDLEAEVERGHFREDLFFRLSVLPIYLPPLRERLEDIEPLALHFLESFNKRYGLKIAQLSRETIQRLKAYHWPGNVRELQNVIERGVVMAQDNQLNLDYFYDRFQRRGSIRGDDSLHMESLNYTEAKQQFERFFLTKLLQSTRGNIAEAARISGRFRSDIYRMMERYDIKPDQFK